jgi:hypothetical protein
MSLGRKYQIDGSVLDRQTSQALAGLRVEAWDKDLLLDDFLGNAVTDAQGKFQICFDETFYQEKFFDRYPDLFFRVFWGDRLVKTTEDSIMWNIRTTQLHITLEIDLPNQATASFDPAFYTNFYKVGGSLEYQHPTYIVRQADHELYQGLQNGELCYVLNSRQMGKSSLRVQTMKRLQQEGSKCAAIDMLQIGSNVTPAEWYGGMISNLIRVFGLTETVDFSTWWRERDLLSPLQRFCEFIEDVLLVKFSEQIVIFIDEIDSILKFPFRDDFFSFIRACYNKRADYPAYQRLTFAFLGVATPHDLIADRNRTPFNIGRAIALNGFSLDEAQSLTQGLERIASQPQAVLREVLNWTGGQPFLTQKLCSLIAASPTPIPKGREVRAVDTIVKSQILSNWQTQDEPEHLRTIRDRLLGDPTHSVLMLELYRQILFKGDIPADGSSAQMLLRLSGAVVQRQNRLYVYNRIYRTLFGWNWADQEIAKLTVQSAAQSFVQSSKSNQIQYRRRYILALAVLFLIALILAIHF